jgi:hypothetical protein
MQLSVSQKLVAKDKIIAMSYATAP